jgi:hypothetical protein
MSLGSKICPYPGLRPFNEEESIFFKGREEHIGKIVNQLQERKFIMVTGASGDGKSSLIYAGLIPRARAGFFKARFNNWIIADFKPEREPVTNLARVISTHLDYNNEAMVEEELGYGFSSLVKLYKESRHYVDYESESYRNAGEEEKMRMKNSCSNVLLLIDQFEELFTNTENYNNGRPSVQAATLTNLIIETTRLANEQNLPLYIVCTMRSDYIGDCAAFKGLPEHIVYSQFFVPRLKRQEIHRAILEPAKLSGNKINNRLIEKIINELGDGLDQLPILQHALNRIWRAHVEDHSEEMDLLHFAKVGGLLPELLPPDQQTTFNTWLNKQSAYKRKILQDASLSNILNVHARELFDYSCENFVAESKQSVTREFADKTLKRIFTCLTKINDNRAVRNRISVKEIKQILGGEIELNNRVIEEMLNPFRDPANTLIRPFITGDPATKKLKDNDLLDITHESLIRNWSELIEWTRQDHENVLVLNDFKKQLERWESNNRSKDYLLTIGSLSYFNSWHINLSPNPYLLAKYDESSISYSEKFSQSTNLIHSANDFLSQSNAAIRQKRRTFVAAASTIALVLVSFTTWAIIERNNAIELRELAMSKTNEATISREEALIAKSIAEKSKEEALKAKEEALANEFYALGAKKLAERSAHEAMEQKNIAMAASEFAEKQAAIARTETQRANVEMEKAKEQKTIAESATEKAVVSEKKARDLSLKSLSQQLAYQSTEKYDDPQINGILALQAYQYHYEAVKNALDPVVYEGLLYARREICGDSSFCMTGETGKEQKLIFETGDKTLMSLGSDGILHRWNKDTKRIVSSEKITAKNGPLNFYFYDKENYCLFIGFDNGTVALYEITPDKRAVNILTYKNLKSLLRAGSYHKTEGRVDLVGKNGEFHSFPITRPAEVKKTTLGNKVISFCRFSDQLLYVGMADGAIMKVTPAGESTAVLAVSNGNATSLLADEKHNKLFVGTSAGNIIEYYANDGKWFEVNTYRISKTPVARIEYDYNLKKCLAVTADKKISILDFASPHSKPAFISTNDLYIRSLVITEQGKVICGTSDFKLREFHTDMNLMARELGNNLKRDMSTEEWTRYVGNDVEYKKQTFQK